ANDLAAIGVLAAADDLGLRVPEDLSVVGYDDSWFARLNRLSLTTVNSHITEVGRWRPARSPPGSMASAAPRAPACSSRRWSGGPRPVPRPPADGQASASRTSSTRTGRCSARDSAAASATQPVSSASSIVQGEGAPVTTSVNAASDPRKASAKRSMKNVYGV